MIEVKARHNNMVKVVVHIKVNILSTKVFTVMENIMEMEHIMVPFCKLLEENFAFMVIIIKEQFLYIVVKVIV